MGGQDAQVTLKPLPSLPVQLSISTTTFAVGQTGRKFVRHLSRLYNACVPNAHNKLACQ